MRRRFRFPGGVHPPERKYTAGSRIAPFAVPPVLRVPLSQHVGAPAAPCVAPKERVLRGQLIGRAQGFISASVHSPVSGQVKAVETRPDQFGRPVQFVVIENDGEEKWAEGTNEKRDPEALTPEAIREAVAEAGIVGMGGATFPTHVKLSPPPDKPIDTLIINGAECEPYLTCDHRLMLEKPEEIIGGLRLLMRAVGARRGIVALEDNKPDAARTLGEALKGLSEEVELVVLPTRYPQGAEKQLIKAVLDREVPLGGLPMDVGVLVQNVGTAQAVFQACAFKRPLIERVVTVTGEGVERPGNFLCRIGTPVEALFAEAGMKPEVNKVLFGGPMMGLAQVDLTLPVTKGTSGVVALVGAQAYRPGPCIRCGACVRGCPMRLLPSAISVAVEAEDEEIYEELNVPACIECGVCTYVCPARRPIVHQVKIAKAVLQRKKKKGA